MYIFVINIALASGLAALCVLGHLGALRWLRWNLYYKAYQIPRLRRFSSRLAVVFAQSIEARC